jgi:hypothetical protein
MEISNSQPIIEMTEDGVAYIGRQRHVDFWPASLELQSKMVSGFTIAAADSFQSYDYNLRHFSLLSLIAHLPLMIPHSTTAIIADKIGTYPGEMARLAWLPQARLEVLASTVEGRKSSRGMTKNEPDNLKV